MNIFELKGPKGNFRGKGEPDGAPETTRKFPLRQGSMVIRIEHHGSGEFELEFSAIEESDEGQADTGIGGIIWATLGTLTNELFGRKSWSTATLTGEFEDFWILRVAEDAVADLNPGEYRIEVSSTARWNCEFIQPDVGQAAGRLSNEFEEKTEEGLVEAGLYVFTPLSAGRRPTMAEIEHKGAGEFLALAFSVDGTDASVIHSETGQFYVEETPTEIKPGKEYILWVEANGEWRIKFTEGY